MNVEFDKRFGYPISVGIDVSKYMPDDWTGWTIYNLTINSQIEPCLVFGCDHVV